MNQFNSLVLGFILLMLQACASTIPMGARHQESGLNSHFNGGYSTFEDYVAHSREVIAKTRATTNVTSLSEIVEGNAPFELKPPASCPPGNNKPYRRGVLLTHGLTDSPYFMRHLGSFFQNNCFRVMAILLPGHGTRPGDLLDVAWQDWANAVSFGTDSLAAEVDEVYLAGFSTGGTLSIYQSQRDARVRGLFLFSPALKVSPLAAFANFHKIYSWASPSSKWLDIMPDDDIYKYESFPKNAAAQIYALTQALNSTLQQRTIDIPVFAAASLDDTTVYTSATIEFMSRTINPSSKLVLYTTDDKNTVINISGNKLEAINSVIPEQSILSFAHTSIVLPPEDKHYGLTGSYSNCIHYYPDRMEKFNECNHHTTRIFQGELTKENLAAGTLRRLMYNPKYPTLESSMKKFIEGLH